MIADFTCKSCEVQCIGCEYHEGLCPNCYRQSLLPAITAKQSFFLVAASLVVAAAFIFPFRFHFWRFLMGRLSLVGAALLGMASASRVYQFIGKTSRQNWASLVASIIIGFAVAMFVLLDIAFARWW